MAILKRKTDLDQEIVSKMLDNAFEASEIAANKVPLEVLASYSNYRRERFFFQRGVLIVVLIAFLLMPLLFVTPVVAFDQGEDISMGRPAYDIKVDTIIPIRRVTAVIEGENMPVFEVGENEYSIRPTTNGTMEITVTLFNDQSWKGTTEVTTLDTTAPVLVEDEYTNGILSFYVEDEGLGLDFESTYAENSKGEIFKPISWDEEAGTVSFDYPKESMNVFFFDKVGNKLQVVLVVQNAKG